MLYESQAVSKPASSVRFKTTPKDPPWALYAIGADSSHDNFSRQLVAAFGVPPDPEKTGFEFQSVEP